MPFDPRLLHDDELTLPGELQALAEQLCADAEHLAAIYPAAQNNALLGEGSLSEGSSSETGETGSSAASGPMPRWTSWPWSMTAAAAIVLALGVQIWWAWPLPQQAAQRKTAPQAADWHEMPPAVSSPAVSSSVPSSEVMTDAPRPTIAPSVFQSLTAPEQEAMLDLIEREQLGEASLSI